MEDEIENVLTSSIDALAEEEEEKALAKTASDNDPSRLEAACFVQLVEKPDGPETDFHLRSSAIRETNTLDEYLILGIDTEYQANQQNYTLEDVKNKRAKYTVLSYQYYAINYSGREWSGIVVPEDGERTSLADFVVSALARGASLGESIPRRIVLVGHYNRADLPAFDDKGKIFGRVQNVRGSMISLRAPLTLRVKFSDDSNDHIDLKLIVRDTILMAPAGRKSLAELGKLIGVEKMKLADDFESEQAIKQHMKEFRAIDWELFRAYAVLDAEIAAKYFQNVTIQYQKVTGSKSFPTALSNIGVDLLTAEWVNRDPPANPLEMVGKERITETIYSETSATFITRTETPFFEEIDWFTGFATECYHGGRNEQMWFGPSWEDEWTDYDFSSAYPTAMALIAKPDWHAIAPIASIEGIKPQDLVCACVDFRFPEKVRYPTLPVRSQHGIIFPLEGRSYCCAPEIELARNLGCEMKLRLGFSIPQNRLDRVFFSFIQKTIAKRQAAASKMENAFWKEITNSCYGKTAQGLREKRVFNLKKKASERVPPSAITNPFFAGYITSVVRALVGEVMNAIPADKMIFSVTTDGFITNATAEEIQQAQNGALCTQFAQIRTELTGKPGIIEEKHNVRKLIGWRTRGQATLKQGDPTRSEPIILARAGIKPPIYTTETAEQNRYIVDTFFARDSQNTIDLDVPTSFREMIVHDADLVFKKAPKRISMEYDFKRRPYSAVQPCEDGSVGPDYNHISFSTVAWKTIEEFNQVRKCHIDYWNKNRQCMKTTADFRDFAELHDGLKALGTKKAAYLKKKNGALRRLQRDLCRAFKHGAAGLENYSELTAKEFADALNESGMAKLGVKTTRSNIENALKMPFSPQTTPPTKEVLEILGELERIFPKLAREEILATMDDGWTIGSALFTHCPFTDRVVREAFNTCSSV